MMYVVYRCKNRYMELDRQRVRTVDMRLLKIQELDRYSNTPATSSSSSGGVERIEQPLAEGEPGSRGVPRTFMIEVRGDLVNYPCAPGEIVQIMGIVRCIQV